MPWHETDQVTERLNAEESGRETMTALGSQFGISRKTGYETAEQLLAGRP